MSDTQSNFKMVTDNLAHCARHQQTFCIASGCTKCKLEAQQWGDSIEITNDPVNHPRHYNDHPSGVECITITRHMNFNIGNAIKYLWRSGKKDKDFEIQDLRKAMWYITNEIERLGQQK